MRDDIRKFNKGVFIIGIIVFLLMLDLCFTFYRERVFNFDSSFFAFQIIDNGDFSIALGRWGGAFGQIIPLLALKVGCTVNTFLRLFSIAPIINYIIIFIVIHFGIKNAKASLLLLFALTLFFRHAFYYTTAELYFGIALCVLFYAVLCADEFSRTIKNKWTFLLLISVLILTISYCHQLTVFPLFFLISHALVINDDFKNRRLWISLALVVVWFIIRIFFLTTSAYESEKIPEITVLMQQFKNLRHLPSTKYFLHFFKIEFVAVIVAYSLSMVYLLYKRKWLYVIFNSFFNLAFLLLILLTYYKGESPLMYENYYVLFGLFCGLPIVEVIHGYLSGYVRYIVVLILLLISLNGIYSAHSVYSEKMEYLDRLSLNVREYPNQKFLVHTSNFAWNVSWISWALPFETALFSADNQNYHSTTFYIVDNFSKYDSLITRENIFLGPDWAPTWFGSQNLNQQFFKFPSSGYVKINSSQSDSTFNINSLNKENLSIIPLRTRVVSSKDDFMVLPIKIMNRSGAVIRSIPDGDSRLQLSYRLYDNAGNLIDGPPVISNLEMDVKESIITGLTIEIPENGEYKVVVDFIRNENWWLGVGADFTLIVQ
jgi:hypothetical protein